MTPPAASVFSVLIACLVVGAACSNESAPESADVSVTTVRSEPAVNGATSTNEDTASEPEPPRCAPDLSGAAPRQPEEFAAAESALSQHMAEGSEYWNSLAPGATSGYDRIAIELNTRNPEFIQSILELVDPDLVCFILPPVGYDDRPPERAFWTLAAAPDHDATAIELLVEDRHLDCGHNPEGRILPPQITYGETEVKSEITLENLLWGKSYTCEGFGPAEFTVQLDEPLNGRTLTGSGR